MISENERRDWIEVGVQATMYKVYQVVTKILVVDVIILLFLPIFLAPSVIMTLFTGISVGLLVFTIASAIVVRADKISRKEVGAVA